MNLPSGFDSEQRKPRRKVPKTGPWSQNNYAAYTADEIAFFRQDEPNLFPDAREGSNQWAGAQATQSQSSQPWPQEARRASSGEPLEGLDLPRLPKRPTASKALREHASRAGLRPGSPRWRAYVLGTLAAMRKTQQSRRKKHRPKP
jgi:hypothetical protein